MIHKWKTREDKLIPVNKLDDRHLLNIGKMLRNKLEEYSKASSALASAECSLQGEMALVEIDNMSRQVEEQLHAIFIWSEIIDTEIKRRKLGRTNELTRTSSISRHTKPMWKNQIKL